MKFNDQRQTIIGRSQMKEVKKAYRVYRCLTLVYRDDSKETLCYNFEDICRDDLSKIKIK